ncbi:MAG: hypothetical protein HQL88_02140 [Magnetococcales bacterium]|nr:hypothetical protein [Magnetococcales bacterium]
MSLRTICLSAVIAAGMSTLAWASADQDFRLRNATGYTIDKVFVSASHRESWGSDVLGQDVLDDGESVNIRFHRDTETCEWDLQVVYTDGESAYWRDIDLCSVSKITIRWNRSSGDTSASFE